MARSVLTLVSFFRPWTLGNTFAPSVAENHGLILRQWKTTAGFQSHSAIRGDTIVTCYCVPLPSKVMASATSHCYKIALTLHSSLGTLVTSQDKASIKEQYQPLPIPWALLSCYIISSVILAGMPFHDGQPVGLELMELPSGGPSACRTAS